MYLYLLQVQDSIAPFNKWSDRCRVTAGRQKAQTTNSLSDKWSKFGAGVKWPKRHLTTRQMTLPFFSVII